MVKNLPCKAGDTGLILGGRTKILHAMEELSPHALEAVLPQLKAPCATTKDPTTKTQSSQINKCLGKKKEGIEKSDWQVQSFKELTCTGVGCSPMDTVSSIPDSHDF